MDHRHITIIPQLKLNAYLFLFVYLFIIFTADLLYFTWANPAEADAAPWSYTALPEPVAGVTKSFHDSDSGPKITLDVKDIEIKDLLSALALKMGVNMVLIENTSDRVSFQFQDTSAHQAFELVIQSQGLDYLQQGDIIIVGLPEALKKDFFNQMVLTRFNTYYITSGKLVELIGNLGLTVQNVTTDSPNVIWAQGTVQELKKVRELIYAVDTPENQLSTEYKTLTLTQISPDRAVDMLKAAGIELKNYFFLNNQLLVFDRELFPRWGQIEELFKGLDVPSAVKQKVFVYQLKNIVAADAAKGLVEFGYEDVKAVTSNNDKFGREVIVICPPHLESQVRNTLIVLDGSRQKVRVPVDKLSGKGAHAGLNAKRSLLSELSGVPVGSMYISGNLSGDSDNPEHVLWVEETPDKIELIKNLISEMKGEKKEN